MSSEGVRYLDDAQYESVSADSDELDVSEEPVELDPLDQEVSIDMTFEVLKNQRRRWVLRYLNEHEGAVSLSDLSEHVAALENGKSVGELSSQERKRVYVGLYQCHLPKMADMGFVKFNKSRGIIELGPAAAHANEYLYDSAQTDGAWPRYYLGLVGFGWLLFGLSVVASDLLVPTVALLLFLLVLTTMAIFHHRAEGEHEDDEVSANPDAVVGTA
jgi:hypothetical protein